MNNLQIRLRLIAHGIKQYELAKELNICESACSKLLREDLSEEDAIKVNKAVDDIILRKEGIDHAEDR